MAKYRKYIFQGRGECPRCRKTNREEFRVQDTETGRRIGKVTVGYACVCRDDWEFGEELWRKEEIDENA